MAGKRYSTSGGQLIGAAWARAYGAQGSNRRVGRERRMQSTPPPFVCCEQIWEVDLDTNGATEAKARHIKDQGLSSWSVRSWRAPCRSSTACRSAELPHPGSRLCTNCCADGWVKSVGAPNRGPPRGSRTRREHADFMNLLFERAPIDIVPVLLHMLFGVARQESLGKLNDTGVTVHGQFDGMPRGPTVLADIDADLRLRDCSSKRQRLTARSWIEG